MKSIVCTAAALIPLFSTPLHASVMKPVEFSQLVKRSSWIIHGRVIKREASWNKSKSRIYTRVTLEVTTPHKGDVEKNETISFIKLGGQVGRYVQRVSGEPHFGIGEEVLVFLERRNLHKMVVGMAQGKFRIERKAGRVTAIRSISCVRWVGKPPRSRFPLKELEKLISNE